jgi:hypothetical protein
MQNIDNFVRRVGIPTSLIIIALITGIYYGYTQAQKITAKGAETLPTNPSSLNYQFKVNGVVEEKSTMSQSYSPYFWVNSGGRLLLKDGVGMTVQSKLGTNDYWRVLYGKNNPLDTDNGYYPQNLFRLVTKSKWDNFEQSVKFNIANVNLTNTPNRGGYSGILLMSRYQDGYNLYYSGVRMDGTAVIKKKYKGTYYTIASGPAFKSATPYNRDTNPNLIPTDKWVGLKSKVTTGTDGSVVIKLFIDRDNTGSWEELLTATDKPGTNGGSPVTGPAYAGIRTDYMDVKFDDYNFKSL